MSCIFIVTALHFAAIAPLIKTSLDLPKYNDFVHNHYEKYITMLKRKSNYFAVKSEESNVVVATKIHHLLLFKEDSKKYGNCKISSLLK